METKSCLRVTLLQSAWLVGSTGDQHCYQHQSWPMHCSGKAALASTFPARQHNAGLTDGHS